MNYPGGFWVFVFRNIKLLINDVRTKDGDKMIYCLLSLESMVIDLFGHLGLRMCWKAQIKKKIHIADCGE